MQMRHRGNTNNLIVKEQAASKQYMLEMMSDDPKLVKPTPDNVARVEAMVHTDSAYSVSWDGTDPASSAYSIKRFKKTTDSGKYTSKAYKELIGEIVKRIDSENSTHLNSDGVGIKEITRRISNIKYADLINYLRNPEETDFKLIDIIAKRTIPKDEKHHGRYNLSFASKFCHYMCFHMFEGEPEQDNYPIYDSVMKEALPLYREYYHLDVFKFSKNTSYSAFRRAIDEVIEAAGGGISRNGFDHLVWYSSK